MSKLALAIYCTCAVFAWQLIFDCMYHAAHLICKISNAALRNLTHLSQIIDENFTDENS